MVVIMENDMADSGTYNPDRRRKNQEKRTKYTAPSQKKSVQTTNKPPARTSLKSSTARKGITKNRKERSAAPLGGITLDLKKLSHSSRNSLPPLEIQSCLLRSHGASECNTPNC
jgi:hypothetical protein